MNKDVCRIKGSRRGLVITISAGADFAEVLRQLQRNCRLQKAFLLVQK